MIKIGLVGKEEAIVSLSKCARRMGSALSAATVPFAFGTFRLYEGRTAYTCVSAQISAGAPSMWSAWPWLAM